MNKKTIFQESIDLQLKARAIGLDWLEVDGVINKLNEETREVIEAITSGERIAIKERAWRFIIYFALFISSPRNLPREKF